MVGFIYKFFKLTGKLERNAKFLFGLSCLVISSLATLKDFFGFCFRLSDQYKQEKLSRLFWHSEAMDVPHCLKLG